MTTGDLGQAPLAALEEGADVGAAGRRDRRELRQGGRLGQRRWIVGGAQEPTVPAWIEMMPPAVTIQRTSSSPTATRTAASSRGPGNRRTELGR